MVTEVYLTDGTLIASVNDGLSNTTTTSISLFGDNFPDYGKQAAENWIHILENFSSTTPPSQPLNGQLWYDKSVGELKVNKGTPGVPNFATVSGSGLSATSLNDLTDVTTAGVVSGQVLKWNGSQWAPGTDNDGGGGGGSLPTGTEGQVLVADGSGTFVPSSDWIKIGTGDIDIASFDGSRDGRIKLGSPESWFRANDSAITTTGIILTNNGTSVFSNSGGGAQQHRIGLTNGDSTATMAVFEGGATQGAITASPNQVHIAVPGLTAPQTQIQKVIFAGQGIEIYSPSGNHGLYGTGVVYNRLVGGFQLPLGSSLNRATAADASTRAQNLGGVMRYNQNIGGPEINTSGFDNGWVSIPLGAPVPDFAEFFESFDEQELSPGTTVIMDPVNPGYVRAAQTGEESDIIGVVRPKSFDGLLQGDFKEWHQKYLRDDYGCLIMEEIPTEKVQLTIESENGATDTRIVSRAVGQTITYESNINVINEEVLETYIVEDKQLNPDYDETMPYVSRRKRPEWQIVGIMGQIPVTKGQPVNPNWILMKEVSPTVDMYLVK